MRPTRITIVYLVFQITRRPYLRHGGSAGLRTPHPLNRTRAFQRIRPKRVLFFTPPATSLSAPHTATASDQTRQFLQSDPVRHRPSKVRARRASFRRRAPYRVQIGLEVERRIARGRVAFQADIGRDGLGDISLAPALHVYTARPMTCLTLNPA